MAKFGTRHQEPNVEESAEKAKIILWVRSAKVPEIPGESGLNENFFGESARNGLGGIFPLQV